MPLMKPIVNLNGTSAEAMVEARLNARNACHDLMKALSETRPHERDYPGNAAAYKRDLEIYKERWGNLDKLYNELMDEAVYIQDGTDPQTEPRQTPEDGDEPSGPGF